MKSKLFVLAALAVSLSGCLVIRQMDPSTTYGAAKQPLLCHGQDILGLPRQNVKMIAQNWEDGECLGVMAGTFGPVIKPMTQILKQNVVPGFRAHVGGFCSHGARCTPGECNPTDLKCLAGKARDFEALHAQFPNTQCYLSPYAEYSSKDQALVKSWFAAIGKAAPSCTLVASSFGGWVPPGVLIERHGNSPGPADIVSNDGDNYFDSDSVAYNRTGRVINFKWTNRNNLRLTSEKGVPLPPLERPLSNQLGLQDLQQMQQMKAPLPAMPTPAFCAAFRNLKGLEVWKNHAEDYGNNSPDKRSNRPLLIIDSQVGQFDLVTPAGKKVACAKVYPGQYMGLSRYYVGSCSGDHAMDLYRKSGDWIFAVLGKTCIGLPTTRRWGSYR